MRKNLTQENVVSGIFGLCVGDALGLPVQFIEREELEQDPVTYMCGYGTYNLPPGSWSDDSSLTFCTMEGMIKEYNLSAIADNFMNWFYNGWWTPFDSAFDIGGTTNDAIENLRSGKGPRESGLTGFHDNGNGSLMRILPVAFYVRDMPLDDRVRITSEVSAITHAHPVSIIACNYYVQFALELMEGNNIEQAYERTKRVIVDYFGETDFLAELRYFNRLVNGIGNAEKNAIKSSGYVIDSLEAAVWCLLTTDSYRKAVLRAVNLGGDTDTIGAITGGLAGLYYGHSGIPKDWIRSLARMKDIVKLCDRFFRCCEAGKVSLEKHGNVSAKFTNGAE